MVRHHSRCGRRELLAMLATSAVGVSTIGSTTARQNAFRRDVSTAQELRSGTHDNSDFVNYLREAGYTVRSDSTVSPLSRRQEEAEDDVSTARLRGGNITATLNLVAWHRNCNPEPYEVYFEYHFDVDTGDDSWGVAKDDGFSIGWPDGTFEVENDEWVSSDNVEFYDRSNMLNGVSYKYDDAKHVDANDSDSGYGGVYVRTEDGYSDSTTIAGKWVHTYRTLELCGFSVAGDGSMSWDFCTDGKKDYMGHVQKDWRDADHRWANC